MIFPSPQGWQVVNLPHSSHLQGWQRPNSLLYNFPQYTVGHILKHLPQSSWSTFFSTSLFGEGCMGQHAEPWQCRVPYGLWFMHVWKRWARITYEGMRNENEFMEEQRDFTLIFAFFEAYADIFQTPASLQKYKCWDRMIREADPVFLTEIFLVFGLILMRVNFCSFCFDSVLMVLYSTPSTSAMSIGPYK